MEGASHFFGEAQFHFNVQRQMIMTGQLVLLVKHTSFCGCQDQMCRHNGG